MEIRRLIDETWEELECDDKNWNHAITVFADVLKKKLSTKQDKGV